MTKVRQSNDCVRRSIVFSMIVLCEFDVKIIYARIACSSGTLLCPISDSLFLTFNIDFSSGTSRNIPCIGFQIICLLEGGLYEFSFLR